MWKSRTDGHRTTPTGEKEPRCMAERARSSRGFPPVNPVSIPVHSFPAHLSHSPLESSSPPNGHTQLSVPSLSDSTPRIRPASTRIHPSRNQQSASPHNTLSYSVWARPRPQTRALSPQVFQQLYNSACAWSPASISIPRSRSTNCLGIDAPGLHNGKTANLRHFWAPNIQQQ